ncbi:MAG: low molecular weight phosphotyrosine protein phosphatase [Myxococcota bacterium]
MSDPRPVHLLVVCSGNQCRSPLAAGLAEELALTLGLELEVRSAGTLGIEGVPAHPHIVAVAREVGVDLTAHRSVPLTEALLRWADAVYVMDETHTTAVHELAPDLAERLVPLGPLIGKPRIEDPIGSWLRAPYRAAREDLLAALQVALPALRR